MINLDVAYGFTCSVSAWASQMIGLHALVSDECECIETNVQP